MAAVELIGEVNPEAIYTKESAMRAMGWRQRAWVSARRKGLRVHTFARRVYVKGSELIRFLTSLDENGEVVE